MAKSEASDFEEISDPLVPVEMEMATLGSMLVSTRSLDRGSKVLTESDFVRPAHQEIFKALLAVGKPDRMLVTEKLIRTKKFNGIGGEAYLSTIAEYMPVEGNFDRYAEIVKDRSVRRQKIALGQKTASEMLDLDRPVLNGEWSQHQVLDTMSFGKEFKPVVPKHLIFPYFQVGKSHLWDADGGSHKTGALTAISAGLTRGKDVINQADCDPVRVLYLHKGEDLSEEIETVFRANGGDSSMIKYVLAPALVFDPSGIELLGNTLADFKAGLLVVDAFFYFLLGLMKGTNDNLPALAVMQPYNAMLAALGVCAEDLRHTTKGKLEKEASELGMGSQQFRNSHRGQLVARYDPKDESENKRVIVTDEKGSLLNPRGKPFAFRRVGLEIQFIREEIENPFTSPEAEAFQKRDKRVRTGTKTHDCHQWLIKILDGCAMRLDGIIERAEDAGFGRSMLFLVKEQLEISTRNQPKAAGQTGRPYAWWARSNFDWTKVESDWSSVQSEFDVEAYNPFEDTE